MSSNKCTHQPTTESIRMPGPQRVSQVLSFVFLLSCGGQSEESEGDATPGRSASPAGTGGEPSHLSTGGTPDFEPPAAGGSGDPPEEEQCPASTAPCVRDCFDLCIPELPTCSSGTPLCSGGAVLRSSCPEGACCATPTHCCDSATGAISVNPCDEEGSRPLCPDGTHATGQHLCLPDLLEGEDCSALDGQPCEDVALNCRSFVGLETYCRCEIAPGSSDAAVWTCAYSAGP